MLYTWTHNINYDETLGVVSIILNFIFLFRIDTENSLLNSIQMPFLVEQLYGSNIIAEYNKKTRELQFQIDVWITKGDNGDECPGGFVIDETHSFCNGDFYFVYLVFSVVQ